MKNNILPHSLPIEILLRDTTEGTLNISNQKNGKQAQTIHQENTNTLQCPVHALTLVSTSIPFEYRTNDYLA